MVSQNFLTSSHLDLQATYSQGPSSGMCASACLFPLSSIIPLSLSEDQAICSFLMKQEILGHSKRYWEFINIITVVRLIFPLCFPNSYQLNVSWKSRRSILSHTQIFPYLSFHEESYSLLSKQTSGFQAAFQTLHFLGHWDLIRYFRTMCVDSQYLKAWSILFKGQETIFKLHSNDM